MRESNEQGGFVKFRPKKDLKPVSSVKIPDHFLSVLPNPLRQSASTKKEETSKDIAAKAKELRAWSAEHDFLSRQYTGYSKA